MVSRRLRRGICGSDVLPEARHQLQSIERLLNYLMLFNADKPHVWKAATRISVDLFNQRFMNALLGISPSQLVSAGRVDGI
jgi:hypothetical protein